MNKLALVNRARRECGVQGAALPNLTSTTLTTESLRFRDWVNQEWLDLQTLRPDWEWMRATATFQTVQGQGAYTTTQAGAPLVAEWKRDTFRCYLTSQGAADEQFLRSPDFDWFRDVYLFGAARTLQGRPIDAAVVPLNHGLVLGPVPDGVYTVEADYHRKAVDLADTGDESDPTFYGLPEQFHMILVYGAMRSYATFEAAPEVYQRAETGHRRLMNRLYTYGLPRPEMGAPLA